MKLRRNDLLAALAAVSVMTTTGCAFEEGNPWGRAEFQVTATFDPPASRLDDGALKTAKDYRVELDRLEATFDAVELEVASGGGSADFDPANPPEGFSLCHNGHCHADSGELVPYEEIEVAQAGGDFVVTQVLEGADIELSETGRKLANGRCSGDCQLTRGELGLVRLSVGELRLSGTLRDVRDRIEPIEIDLVLGVDATLATPLEGTVGPGEPGGVRVDVAFELPASLLDEVDFAVELGPDGSLVDPRRTSELVRRSIETAEPLDASVERFELP